MFGLFKSTPANVKVVDKVWLTTQAKWNACAELLRLNSNCMFVVWFEETFLELIAALNLTESNDTLFRAQQVTGENIKNRMVVFAEHYPLVKLEQKLFSTLNLTEVPVMSSLDEPLLFHFGGEKLLDLMKKMGVKDDEIIGNAMITKSIQRAQESILKKVLMEHTANSQSEWFSLNVSKK